MAPRDRSSSAKTLFFIAGVRRSGTTLIRTTLDSHPTVRCIGEAFNFTGRFQSPAGDKLSYQRYLHESRLRQAADLVNRRGMVERYLEGYFADPEHSALGLKLMIKHAQEFPSAFNYLRRNGAKAIHVVRRNVLKTLISRAVKKQTRIAHSRNAQSVKQITLEAGRLITDLDRIHQSNIQWVQLLKGFPYMQVVYEDFAEDTEAELARMYDFLGVEHLPNVRSHLVKVNPNEISRILLNYDEVSSVLRGTRYEWCLEEDTPASAGERIIA